MLRLGRDTPSRRSGVSQRRATVGLVWLVCSSRRAHVGGSLPDSTCRREGELWLDVQFSERVSEPLKMIKVINVTDIENGKQALLCLRFVYLRLSRISLFRFLLLNDEYILLIAAEIDS